MARVRLTLCVVLAFMASAQESAGVDRCVRLESRDRSMTARSGDDLKLLEALNRCDLLHLARLDSLVVPCSSGVDLMQFSPFPQRADGATTIDRLLVVDEAWQAFGAYEQGRLVRWGPVSSGRNGLETPTGHFHLNWRSPGRHSTVNPRWFMPLYFNFDNDRGLAFHQFALPGRPASHACVRLLERDARWLYGWGRGWTLDSRGENVVTPGTPVRIYGAYEFGDRPPWRVPERVSAGTSLPSTLLEREAGE
jgi:hypothetical protein